MAIGATGLLSLLGLCLFRVKLYPDDSASEGADHMVPCAWSPAQTIRERDTLYVHANGSETPVLLRCSPVPALDSDDARAYAQPLLASDMGS